METNPSIIEFVKSYEEVKRKALETNSKMSKLDLKISNLYHKLEEVHFNHVSKSHNFMKELREALKQRRSFKAEFHQFLVVQKTFNTMDEFVKSFKNQQKKKG